MSRNARARSNGVLSRPTRRRGPGSIASDLYATHSGFRFLGNFVLFGWLTIACLAVSGGLGGGLGAIALPGLGLSAPAPSAPPLAQSTPPQPAAVEAAPAAASQQRGQVLSEALSLPTPPAPALADYRVPPPAAGESSGARNLLQAGDAALRSGRSAEVEAGLIELRRAADAGLTPAMALYGLARLSPPAGVLSDSAAGREWLGRAAQAGDVQAARMLGQAFLTGAAGYSAPDRAREMFKRGQELGDSASSLALADLLARGVGGPADPQMAEQVLRIAAERGEPAATAALGRYLAASAAQGWSPSYDEAIVWLTRAAGQGDLSAMEKLGDVRMFQAKAPPAQDLGEGFAWYRRCADAGRAACHFAVGRAYGLALGVAGDLPLAWAHLSLARDAGQPRAAAELEAVEKRMTAGQREQGLARLGELKRI
jgi:TPR repeat protein